MNISKADIACIQGNPSAKFNFTSILILSGHFGVIDLPATIYHPYFIAEVVQILNQICPGCLTLKKEFEKVVVQSFTPKFSLFSCGIISYSPDLFYGLLNLFIVVLTLSFDSCRVQSLLNSTIWDAMLLLKLFKRTFLKLRRK